MQYISNRNVLYIFQILRIDLDNTEYLYDENFDKNYCQKCNYFYLLLSQNIT